MDGCMDGWMDGWKDGRMDRKITWNSDQMQRKQQEKTSFSIIVQKKMYNA